MATSSWVKKILQTEAGGKLARPKRAFAQDQKAQCNSAHSRSFWDRNTVTLIFGWCGQFFVVPRLLAEGGPIRNQNLIFWPLANNLGKLMEGQQKIKIVNQFFDRH